ncbi:hypothetical protein [Synechococcus sp. LTW-G]
MNLSIDQQVDAAHSEAERIEADALQIEARIVKAGGIPPRRQYGKPVNSEAIRQSLTLVGLLNKRDPALASYLGIQSGSYAREAAERAERQAVIERMQALTEQTRQANQAAQLHRERASNAGINPTTGLRLI